MKLQKKKKKIWQLVLTKHDKVNKKVSLLLDAFVLGNMYHESEQVGLTCLIKWNIHYSSISNDMAMIKKKNLSRVLKV